MAPNTIPINSRIAITLPIKDTLIFAKTMVGYGIFPTIMMSSNINETNNKKIIRYNFIIKRHHHNALEKLYKILHKLMALKPEVQA